MDLVCHCRCSVQVGTISERVFPLFVLVFQVRLKGEGVLVVCVWIGVCLICKVCYGSYSMTRRLWASL